MTQIEDLKSIVLLKQLSTEMLEKILPYIELTFFKKADTIFHEGNAPKDFYMLKSGKILLEKRISSKITVSLGAVKPGYSFGWSSILSKEPFTTEAVCSEACEIFTIKGDQVIELLNSDHSMAFSITQSLTRVLKDRLDRMAEQFLRSIREHPDIKSLLEGRLKNLGTHRK